MAKNYRLIVQDQLQEITISDPIEGEYTASLNGREYKLELEPLEYSTLFRLRVDGQTTPLAIRRDGASVEISIGADRYRAEIERSAGMLSQSGPAIAGEVRISAPMTGQITEVLVAEGDRVAEGDPLLVMVAMKMNNEIRSPADGVVTTVAVQAGDAVEQGASMLVIDTGAE